MTPTWLDFDRLQMILAGLAVLGVALALVSLAVVRPTVAKVVAVTVFVVIGVGAVWQHQTLDDARRTDCRRVEVVGTQVRVPACPGRSPS